AVVCGEMAGSAFYVPLLIGLGAKELSMNVNVIPQIRRLIRGITVDASTELADSISSCETADEVELLVNNYYLTHWSDLFPHGILSSKHR
ncbi:MAG: putative PEP-binding protein, partial [Acidobacteriota bacterium]